MRNTLKYMAKLSAVAARSGGAGRWHPLMQNIRLYLTGFLDSRIQVKNSKNHAKMR
jgi:hypothetical protein